MSQAQRVTDALVKTRDALRPAYNDIPGQYEKHAVSMLTDKWINLHVCGSDSLTREKVQEMVNWIRPRLRHAQQVSDGTYRGFKRVENVLARFLN